MSSFFEFYHLDYIFQNSPRVWRSYPDALQFHSLFFFNQNWIHMQICYQKKFSKGYLIPSFPFWRAGLFPLTLPMSGSYSLCTSWTIVLFPQPLFPTRATVCPLSTRRLRPFKIFKGKREKEYTSHQKPEREVIWLNFKFGKIVLNKGI